jgi:hypothetical protein
LWAQTLQWRRAGRAAEDEEAVAGVARRARNIRSSCPRSARASTSFFTLCV